MSSGELLTKLSIWLALVAYTLGASLLLEARGCAPLLRVAGWAWTTGCVFFLVHVACAFAVFHHWSHTAAYDETARQTAALTGWHWGGGLYFNYLFAAAWLADVLWWWLAPTSYFRRPRWLSASWHGFLFFMVVNGAVVFVHGPMRWVGASLCGALTPLTIKRWRQTRGANPRTAN